MGGDILFTIGNYVHDVLGGAALGGAIILTVNSKLKYEALTKVGFTLLLGGLLGGYALFIFDVQPTLAGRFGSPYWLAGYYSN